ncbi:MAG: uracil-DNA glycosylase [Lentisphaeria bacterium]|nr:uracil-DNA glycosylase [Lentisphaeria bacterium]
MSAELPEAWQNFLYNAGISPEIWEIPLAKSIARRTEYTVFPPEEKVFNAFKLTPPEKVRVVLLGQDPYHDDGQAEGLAFSVPDGVPLPPSLRNIYKEFADDLQRPAPSSGNLSQWAAKGVLLINAVLTVDAHSPGSHAKYGWEKFTDAVIRCLNNEKSGIIFMLWGGFARKKAALIDRKKHFVLENAHPSPLSAYRGFFGSKPFSQVEKLLNCPFW